MTAIDTAASQSSSSPAERTISAMFKDQQQIDGVIRRLLDVGFPATTSRWSAKTFTLKPKSLASSLRKM